MISESEELEAVQQTVEISTPRGKVHGVFYPADGARGAVVMVGGAGGGIHGPSGTYEELAPFFRGRSRRLCVSNTARRTTSTSAYTTFSRPSLLWEIGE